MFSKNIIFENFKRKKIKKKLKIFYQSIVENRTKKKNLINSFTKIFNMIYENEFLLYFLRYSYIFNYYIQDEKIIFAVPKKLRLCKIETL